MVMGWKVAVLALTCLMMVPGGGLAHPTDVQSIEPKWDLVQAQARPSHTSYVHPSPLPSSPYVVATYPADGAINVPISSDIVITFDVPMDEPYTDSAISVAPSINLAYKWSDNYMTMTLSPYFSVLQYDTWYIIGVSTAAMSQTGSHMQSPFSFSFKTVIDEIPSKVTKTYPSNGSTVSRHLPLIRVTFSKSMGGDVVSSVSIANVALSSPNWYPANRTLTLDASALSKDGTYTVVVDASIARDSAGSMLDGDGDGKPGGNYVFSFKFFSIGPSTVTLKALNAIGSMAVTDVEFTLSQNGQVISVKRSGAGNAAQFTSLFPGRYEVQAKKDGFFTCQGEVDAPPGGDGEMTFQMMEEATFALIVGGSISAVVASVLLAWFLYFRVRKRCPGCRKRILKHIELCPFCGYDFIRRTKAPLHLTMQKGRLKRPMTVDYRLVVEETPRPRGVQRRLNAPGNAPPPGPDSRGQVRDGRR